MDKIIVTTWLVVAAIIFGSCMFWAGLEKAKRKITNPYAHDDTGEIIPGFLGIAFFWPVAIIVSPFVGLYYLGKYLGTKLVKGDQSDEQA